MSLTRFGKVEELDDPFGLLRLVTEDGQVFVLSPREAYWLLVGADLQASKDTPHQDSPDVGGSRCCCPDCEHR